MKTSNYNYMQVIHIIEFTHAIFTSHELISSSGNGLNAAAVLMHELVLVLLRAIIVNGIKFFKLS